MSETPLLGITELEASQSQPEIPVNEAIRVLESGAGQLIVIDKDLSVPPVSPAEGDVYIIPSGASGVWASFPFHIAICIGGLLWFLTPGAAKKEEAYHQQPKATHSEYVPPVAVPVAAVIPPPPPMPPPMVQPLAPSLLQPRAASDGPAPAKPEPRPAVYSYASSTMPDYMKPKSAPVANGADTTGGIAFKPASFEGTKTFTIPHRDFLLMRWTTMICVMDTEIITGASGSAPFRCHLKNAVLSPTGVTLLEAGTIVGGTYTSLVGEGQSRIVAVTAEAQSPNGVIADIGGPIADQLGAAGVEGSVNEHWMQRIGGALLLTLVDSGMQLLNSEIQKNSQNTNISLGSGGGGGLSQLGNQLLSKTINIPPTITLNQGTEVALWVTKFIDFSPSYQLEAK